MPYEPQANRGITATTGPGTQAASSRTTSHHLPHQPATPHDVLSGPCPFLERRALSARSGGDGQGSRAPSHRRQQPRTGERSPRPTASRDQHHRPPQLDGSTSNHRLPAPGHLVHPLITGANHAQRIPALAPGGLLGIGRVAASRLGDLDEAVGLRGLHCDLSRGEDPVVVVVDGVAGHCDRQRAGISQVDTGGLQVV